MYTSILQFVVQKLEENRGHWREISAKSGVSVRTIEKIGHGETANPRVQTVEQLAKFFREANPRTQTAQQRAKAFG